MNDYEKQKQAAEHSMKIVEAVLSILEGKSRISITTISPQRTEIQIVKE